MDKKMILEFDVVKQCLIRRDSNKPVEGSENYLYAKFKFSSDYEGLNIKAKFENNGVIMEEDLNEDNMCIVPAGTIHPSLLSVSILGYSTYEKDDEGKPIVKITTNIENIRIYETIDPEENEKPTNPDVNLVGAVKMTFKEQVSPDTTLELKEIEIGNDKWKLGGSGGGIVDVNSLPKSSWVGTKVPNNEYVSDIYFNKELTYKEINDILSQIGYPIPGSEIGIGEQYAIYPIIANEEASKLIVAVKEIYNDLVNLYHIGTFTPSGFEKTYLDAYRAIEEDGVPLYDSPWLDFENPVVVDIDAIPGVQEVNISGTQNELLKSLISTTPFVYKEEKIDEKSIYRLKIPNEYTTYIPGALEEETEGIGDAAVIEFVEKLPESGLDFYEQLINSGKLYIYYNTTINKGYIWSGVYTNLFLQTAINSWIETDFLASMGTAIAFIRSKDEIDENSETIYILIKDGIKLFVYKENWVELITTDNIDKYKPKEHHLYEHQVNLSSPDYINIFEINFSFLDNKINNWNDFHNILPILANTDTGSDFYAAATGYYREGFVKDGTIKQITAISVDHSMGMVYLYNSEGEKISFSGTAAYNYTYTYGGYRQIF